MRALRRILTGAVLVSALVVGVSGAWLAWFWRPQPSWTGYAVDLHALAVVQPVHRIAAWCLILAAVGLGTEAAARVVGAGARRLVLVVGVAGLGVVALLAAFASGFLLPWDQVALWAVRVGTNMRGVLTPFDSQVRFVLVGGAEVSPAAYRVAVVVHIVVLPAAAALCLVAARRLAGRRARGAGAGAAQRPEPASTDRNATGLTTPSRWD